MGVSTINFDDSELKKTFLEVCSETMEFLKKHEPDKNILTQKDVLELFDISYGTLKEWEIHGLDRLTPPYESSKVFYKYSEIVKFLEGN